MFTVIYSFQVKQGEVQSFKKAWRDMTLLILEYEGSLGSRLHKQNELTYIGYAQWPTKNAWINSGNNLPEASEEIRKIMRATCEKIETLFELEVVDDLLKNKPSEL